MEEEVPYFLQYTPDSQLENPVDTKITGEVPKWLKGTLYRNGSGMFKIGKTRVKHLFDGMSVLHKFVISDGKVQYQQKLLDSETLQLSLKANRLLSMQFATNAIPDPCKNIFSRYFSYFFENEIGDGGDNTAVNIVPHGDMLIALTENVGVNVIDPETLTKKDRVRIDKAVAVHLATAHPHSDEEGNMYNLGTCFSPHNAYNIVKIPPKDKGGENPFKHASLVSTFPSRWKFNISYNHSFGMSQNYFVVLEQTLTVNNLKLPFMRLTGMGFESCMTDYPKEKMLFNISSRSDGKRSNIRYTADTFFCFHFINCYEEDDNLVVDLVGFDSADIVRHLYLKGNMDTVLGDYRGTVRRYVLPLNISETKISGAKDKNLVTLANTSATAIQQADGTVFCTPDYITGEEADGVIMELPRINYSYNTRKYRYVYGTGFLTENAWLIKLDLQTKKVTNWKPESKDQAGEPVFVSRPGGTDEDDGVILSPITPFEPDRQAYLIILDAKTFKEKAQAVAPPGVKMPITFHGSFVP